MDLRTGRERAGPEGKLGTDARILRVSSTQASRGRLPKRSEMSSMGDFSDWGGVPSHWVSAFFDSVTGVCLGPSVTLGADFVMLPVFQVLFSRHSKGASVTGPEVCCGSDGGVALTT